MNNVYVTWTIFRFDSEGFYVESPIFFTRSEDGGQTWTAPLEISGSSADCTGGDGFDPTEDPTTCNFDQGSYPVVGPDGSVNVVFNNCNTPEAAPLGGVGICQQMFVKSTDAGDTWTDPVVVSDDIGLQPFSVPDNEIPDCPLFRQCPPKRVPDERLPLHGHRRGDGAARRVLGRLPQRRAVCHGPELGSACPAVRQHEQRCLCVDFDGRRGYLGSPEAGDEQCCRAVAAVGRRG